MNLDIFEGQDVIITEPQSNGSRLFWTPGLGIGYLPSRGYDYGEMYWENYLSYNNDNNSIGSKLTDYRIFWVLSNIQISKNAEEEICDVGIGNGQFVEEMLSNEYYCDGFDINTYAKAWLENFGRFGNPYKTRYKVLTFWDVLEHIDDPTEILSTTDYVFTSLPIFKDMNHALSSKHFKPDEHIWYFTDSGIKHFMGLHGFSCFNQDDGETRIGREGIVSYYFKRNK